MMQLPGSLTTRELLPEGYLSCMLFTVRSYSVAVLGFSATSDGLIPCLESWRWRSES
jgi:hypothetical protein